MRSVPQEFLLQSYPVSVLRGSCFLRQLDSNALRSPVVPNPLLQRRDKSGRLRRQPSDYTNSEQPMHLQHPLAWLRTCVNDRFLSGHVTGSVNYVNALISVAPMAWPTNIPVRCADRCIPAGHWFSATRWKSRTSNTIVIQQTRQRHHESTGTQRRTTPPRDRFPLNYHDCDCRHR